MRRVKTTMMTGLLCVLGMIAAPSSMASPASEFGIAGFDIMPLNNDGTVDTQAGSHPFELVTDLSLNRTAGGEGPAALAKDLRFALPPGLIGNPQVVQQCTEKQFTTYVGSSNQCPTTTAIGVAAVTLTGFLPGQETSLSVPLFNLKPSVGEPARFGFEVLSVSVYLDTKLRTGRDYGVTVNVSNLSQILGFISSRVTFWGVPGDPAHDEQRGWSCLLGAETAGTGPCVFQADQNPTAFLTLPTSCAGPMRATVEADSWDNPDTFTEPTEYVLHDADNSALGMDGCDRLDFSPKITVAPDGEAGSTPTGLTVGVHVPQGATLVPGGLSEADVKDTTVTLPNGVQLSPSAADGLLACSTDEMGYEGVDPNTNGFLFSADRPSCPEASKVATVSIRTPLLPNELKGSVYLAAQDLNPFNSLLALYLVARDPVSGSLIKLPGRVSLNATTGQITSTFRDTPQVPFEDLELHFFGTARAPLTTPAICGSYTTATSITPWSGNPAASPSSTFQITRGPGATPCSDPLPFTPSFEAGTTNIQAGGFTPFALTMSRPDGDQTLSEIDLKLPVGLSGMLSHVKLCPEPQASQGSCGPDSLIGRTVVSAGLGGDPYTVNGGRVFITGPYKGAPFGLSILNPAVAGPFNLGSVVVRAAIRVDRRTAALDIRSDPLPTILDGIPLQLQHVNVTVDRGSFTFNPTNCIKMRIDGSLTSTEGARALVDTSFQVTNCAALKFKPKLTASTTGKTSRARGASLTVKLAYPLGQLNANIAKVKVDLPKQLPSRLTTLQKACIARTFETNPANCPAASIVGHATATTPILPVALTGPAYFVSHGGEAFPDLEIVLQGYGVTVILEGSTFISSKGITSSTFKAVPDVPVGTFELVLPQGKYSALAANGKLCKSKLRMPTAFVAQNGLRIQQSTNIVIKDCSRRKADKAARGRRVS